MNQRFDRIQSDIGSTKEELLEKIETFNELLSEMIKSDEWSSTYEMTAMEIRKNLQAVEYEIQKFKP